MRRSLILNIDIFKPATVIKRVTLASWLRGRRVIVIRALVFKEILAVLVSIVIVLNVDLVLFMTMRQLGTVFLQNGNHSAQLRSFYLLGVEIVSFSDIQVRNYIFHRLASQHAPVHQDFVEVLSIAPLFKVVHDCQLGWVVFEHQLSWHRGHQRPTQR